MPTARTFLFSLLALLSLSCGPSLANDEPFPNRPVTIVVPFPAGGRADLSARLLATRLHRAWNTPVLVNNRAGGGGSVGSRSVAEARPDGYTLLFTSSALLSAQYLTDNAPRLGDFQPIGIVEVSYPVLVARKGLQFSLKNLAAHRSAGPDKLSIATVSGATAHVATEAFLALARVDMTRIPFKGEADTVAALLGGHIDLATSGWATIQNQVKAGNLVPIAVAAPARVPEFASVPTFRESGIDLTLDVFEALLAPRDTPPRLIAALEKATGQAMADPSLIHDMKQIGLHPQYIDASGSLKFMLKQDAQFRAIVSR